MNLLLPIKGYAEAHYSLRGSPSTCTRKPTILYAEAHLFVRGSPPRLIHLRAGSCGRHYAEAHPLNLPPPAATLYAEAHSITVLVPNTESPPDLQAMPYAEAHPSGLGRPGTL